MESEWRTIQIFLGKDLNKNGAAEISEVSIWIDAPNCIQCTCKLYSKAEICEHVLFVENKMKKNNGSFGLAIPDHVPNELAYEAFSSSESSRDFVLYYGKIEVI